MTWKILKLLTIQIFLSIPTSCATIPVALFIDPSIKNADAIFEQAKKEIQQLSPNVTLEIIKHVTGTCDAAESDTQEIYDFFKNYYNDNNRISIGPTCVKNLFRFANLTAEVQTLQMNVLMGYPDYHPTMIDMVTRSPRNLAENMIAIMKGFEWTQVGLFICEECYENDVLATENYFGKVQQYLDESLKNVMFYKNFSKDASSSDIAPVLAETGKQARVFFTFMGNDLSDYQQVLKAFDANNFSRIDYQPVIFLTKSPTKGLTYPWTADASLFPLFQKTVLVINNCYSDQKAVEFLSKYSFSSQDESITSLQLYEAYHVLGNYLYSASMDPTLANYIRPEDAISSMNITGPFGEVFINNEGQRVSPFDVMYVNGTAEDLDNVLVAVDNIFVDRTCERKVCLISSRSQQEMMNKTESSGINQPLKSIPLPLFEPVKDVPVCGFSNENCDQSGTNLISRVILLMLILMGAVFAILLIYMAGRKLMKTTNRRSMVNPWSMLREDIKFIDTSTNLGSQFLSMQSLKKIIDDRPVTKRKKLGTVEQTYVLIDTYYTRDKVKFDKADSQILYAMKSSIQHDNINQFVGVCIEKTEISIVWNQCFRGSLYDLILMKKMVARDTAMNNNVQGAFVRDILKGLDYLHSSSINFHGALTSLNCMVDSHWILKLTGFGTNQMLYKLKNGGEIFNRDNSPIIPTSELYYYAPEVRRLMKAVMDNPNKTETAVMTPAMGRCADMYSFGVVLYEITFKTKLVDMTDMREGEIVECSLIDAKAESLVPLYHLPPSDVQVHPDLISLLHRCWTGTSKDRPDPALARKITDAVLKMSGSLVDQMMHNLNAYTGGLQVLVEAQTLTLKEEQVRGERLLLELIPKAIADELRHNRRVYAKTFHNATILYSDIVGFTSLCSESQPMEVVDLLSGMYFRFDLIIDKQKGYKMETIGDAYCVVAGLPEESVTEHVEIIATIALLQREFLHGFEIPHRPGQYLNCRWGFNSGTVFAGVIGMKAPRYACFGSTVSIAAKMESTGTPDRIQITLRSQQLLAEYYPKFICNSRGVCRIPDLGTFLTYWLEGISDVENDPKINKYNKEVTEELRVLYFKKEESEKGGNSQSLPPKSALFLNKEAVMKYKMDHAQAEAAKKTKTSVMDTPPDTSTEATPISTPPQAMPTILEN